MMAIHAHATSSREEMMRMRMTHACSHTDESAEKKKLIPLTIQKNKNNNSR
jgi:hypothetical protein